MDFTSDRLLFNVLWTSWVCLGTRLEENDLVHDFGDVYENIGGESHVHSMAWSEDGMPGAQSRASFGAIGRSLGVAAFKDDLNLVNRNYFSWDGASDGPFRISISLVFCGIFNLLSNS